MKAYQFAHIAAYYNQQKRNAYAYNRIELGDMYDRYAMRMYKLSIEGNLS